MKKILVTTDLSPSSGSAIRLSLRIAKMTNASLTVILIHYVPKPFSWSETAYSDFRKGAIDELEGRIKKFVHKLARAASISAPEFSVSVISATAVVKEITAFARSHHFDYIFISTRGAGTIRKFLGTHTSKLLSTSNIPVISVPSSYRYRGISKITYATDLQDYAKELPKVMHLASLLNCQLNILVAGNDPAFQEQLDRIKKQLSRDFPFPFSTQSISRDYSRTLIYDIDHAIERSRTSMVIFFSHHDKTGFEKFLLPSNATAYSFYSKIPLVVYNKNPQ